MSEWQQRLSDEASQLLARFRANDTVQAWEHKYHALADRERVAVNTLLLFISLLLLYRLLLVPAWHYFDAASKAYQRQLEGYQWMLSKEPEVQTLLSSEAQAPRGSLLSLASTTAKQHNLSFNRFEPIGEDRVRLWLERVEFNQVVAWLGQLEADEGVSAVDISLDSSSPGYVSVRLTLQG